MKSTLQVQEIMNENMITLKHKCCIVLLVAVSVVFESMRDAQLYARAHVDWIFELAVYATLNYTQSISRHSSRQAIE